MQQLTFIEPGKLAWHEVADPQISAACEAIVRPLAVTRCDLDLYIARGDNPLPGPFGFGHEIAGEVVSVGSGVTSVAPGDQVIVPFQISCGTCANCLRGCTNACTSVPAYSAYGLAPSVGLFAVQTAVALGASAVVYTDSDARRLAAAASLGAETHQLDYRSHPATLAQFAVVVDASATAGGLEFALRSTVACGVCTGVSAPVGSWMRP